MQGPANQEPFLAPHPIFATSFVFHLFISSIKSIDRGNQKIPKDQVFALGSGLGASEQGVFTLPISCPRPKNESAWELI
jgi:hypothetical protein